MLISQEPYQLSPDVQKFVDSVNQTWADIEQRRQQSDEQKAELDAEDPMSLDLGKTRKARGKWREQRITLLRDVVACLRRLESWPATLRAERFRAYDRAHAEQQRIAEEIAAKLRGIGYEDVHGDGVFVLAHPRVTAASNRLREIFWLRDTPFNAASINSVLTAAETELRDLVDTVAAA